MFHRNFRSDSIVTEEQSQTDFINSIDPLRIFIGLRNLAGGHEKPVFAIHGTRQRLPDNAAGGAPGRQIAHLILIIDLDQGALAALAVATPSPLHVTGPAPHPALDPANLAT